jgi:hypothetical protein
LVNVGNFSYLWANDSWINVAARLTSAHGVAADTTNAQGLVGPTVTTFLAFARELVTGPVPSATAGIDSSKIVVSAYLLLIVTTPIVVAFLAHRVLRQCRLLLTILAWLVAAVLLVCEEIVFADLGLLSVVLVLPLVVVAADACTSNRAVEAPTNSLDWLYWLGSAVLIFSVGMTWVLLLPVAAIALASWAVVTLFRFVHRRSWPKNAWPLACCLVSVLMECAFWRQYHLAAHNAGGTAGLFGVSGSVVFNNDTAQILAIVLLAAAWYLKRRPTGGEAQARGSLLTPILWLASYLLVVELAEAWLTKTPGMPSAEVGTAVLAVWLVLAVVEMSAASGALHVPLRLAIVGAVAVVVAATLGQGMVYTAVADRWPQSTTIPTWVSVATQEVSAGATVFCLNSFQSGPDSSDFDPQTCSIYAAHDAGVSSGILSDWIGVITGAGPVSRIITDFQHREGRRWVVIVFGPVQKRYLYRAGNPFDRLLRLKGLTLVAA